MIGPTLCGPPIRWLLRQALAALAGLVVTLAHGWRTVADCAIGDAPLCLHIVLDADARASRDHWSILGIMLDEARGRARHVLQEQHVLIFEAVFISEVVFIFEFVFIF